MMRNSRRGRKRDNPRRSGAVRRRCGSHEKGRPKAAWSSIAGARGARWDQNVWLMPNSYPVELRPAVCAPPGPLAVNAAPDLLLTRA
jgi:hypothetical protein